MSSLSDLEVIVENMCVDSKQALVDHLDPLHATCTRQQCEHVA